MNRRALLSAFAAAPVLAAPALLRAATTLEATAIPAAAGPGLDPLAGPAPVTGSPEVGPITFPDGATWPIAKQFYPTEVPVKASAPVGSIIVVSERFHLYHVFAPGRAMRFGVAVGKEELKFRGQATVQRKVEWPSWTPTKEMIERSPEKYEKYADGMPGGPKNPLGARAMYLFQDGRDTAIRIHGTTEPSSIGHAVSNGCLRMVNDHVIALYERVTIGTPVTVF